ncbi:hypothetical protein M2R47_01880 [Moraxella sp. Tifton1]|uniref:Type IV pilus modification protein PilV n=1 Tax=Moraxella oculi TaxID=2940516 RepID=A0ABW8UA26_9GAMM|nr:hypothetical protein [Moraxella sp. Tifton1]MCL1623004.1 hypothetical protein [Moraxella sp. Tifton1]
MRLAYHQGFGLIESLVALLLVSMAVLGFLMVQFKAIHATKDAAMRTVAITTMTIQAEVFRDVDDVTRRSYANMFGRMNQSTGTSMQMLDEYRHAINGIHTACDRTQCHENEAAWHRAIANAKLAVQEGVRLNVVFHDGTHRLIAAWGDTPATQSEDGCLSLNGVINQGARCMTMVY